MPNLYCTSNTHTAMAKKAKKKTPSKVEVNKQKTSRKPAVNKEKTMPSKPQQVVKKPKTIKDALSTDIDLFRDLKEVTGVTDGEFLSLLLQNYNGQNNNEDTEALKAELETLRAELETLRANGIAQIETINGCETSNKLLLEKNEVLANEVQRFQNECIALQENQIVLDDDKNQFIASFSDEAFEIARKCRPFLRRDEYISTNDATYPQELINVIIPYGLKTLYPHLFKK